MPHVPEPTTPPTPSQVPRHNHFRRSMEFAAYVAPVACSPLIWSPGGRSPQPPTLQARSDTPRETRQNSRRQWPSRLLSLLSPPADCPRVSSAYITVPDDRPAHVRRKTSHPRANPRSAASRRRSLCFAQRRRHVRQQDASRDCQEWCASPDVPHWTKSAGTIPP